MYFDGKGNVQCEKPDTWAKDFRGACERAYEGETLHLAYHGKPWATVRAVDDGGLPEDGNYVFVALSDQKSADIRLKEELKRALEKGQSVVIKDSEKKPIRRRNANLVLFSKYKV